MRASASSSPSPLYEIRQRPAVGGRDEQLADRRVDDVVAHVDEPLAERGGAEAGVELRRDVHGLLLSLRTPDDAAARAASSDEPSASPIWA